MRKSFTTALNGFFARPWLIAICVFVALLIPSLIFCFGLKTFELVSVLLGIATIETLIVTAIYIFKYWKEAERTNELSLKNTAYSRLPILDFKVEVHYQDPEMKYFDERITLHNKGYGPAFAVYLSKAPLADNAQKKALTGKSGPNNHVQKTYNLVGPGESIFFYQENGYPAKEVQITVRFMDMFKRRFEWEYKGAPQDLQLSRWHIDPADKNAPGTERGRSCRACLTNLRDIFIISPMPRLARLDAPEVLHHVMGRGIEKKKIFFGDQDRSDFLSRLATLGEEKWMDIYAWALLPNHILC